MIQCENAHYVLDIEKSACASHSYIVLMCVMLSVRWQGIGGRYFRDGA